MTTIAADLRLGLIASDSQWSDGDEIGDIRKVFRINGDLVGLAGDLSDIALVRAWLRSRKGKPPASKVSALILGAKSLQVWTSADGFTDVGPSFAIGTGGKAARAAMLAGATPTEAVRIVSKIDAGTGGKVRAYKLKATN